MNESGYLSKNLLKYIHLFMTVLGLRCCLRLSLVAVHGLLIVVTSPVAEHIL